ncbi:hypothetical protein [Smaragdicoccus niigatensis]|uniref:hypothetical protein n=1 Tax=Smaragdicoccus niigatensis TaxID=359359 RepID=UPI000367FB61|nr:hypothetical protein [Smaragdicoccus niigatensis]
MSRFRSASSGLLIAIFVATIVPATASATPVDDVRGTVTTTQQKLTNFQNRFNGTDGSECGEGEFFCPIIAWVRRENP